jgi:hypothetical protein
MTLYDGSTLIFFLDFTVPRSQGRWNCVYIAVIILANYFVPGVKKMWCFARPIADSFQSRCWQSSHDSTCPWGLLVPVRSAYKRIAPVNPMKSCCSGLSSLFFSWKRLWCFFHSRPEIRYAVRMSDHRCPLVPFGNRFSLNLPSISI